MLGEHIHNFLISLVQLERRYEPFWRPRANALFREPLAAAIQALINLRRRDEGLELAKEAPTTRRGGGARRDHRRHGRLHAPQVPTRRIRAGGQHQDPRPGARQLRRARRRAGGAAPGHLSRRPCTFPTWVRFSGPGPDSPPDIDDVGFMSMSLKLMGVPGPKLLEDEQKTQDFLSVCTPTFVTPDVTANAQLQAQLLRRTPFYYFINPRHPHLLDMFMQSLWNETQTSPLECQYYSCTPFLLGAGRAMQFSLRPRQQTRSRIPGLPGRPPDHYLRDNMAATLAERTVDFDFLIQTQTDAHAMPIENAAVRWPQRLSPYVPAATVHIHQQRFDSPAQLEFARTLSYTPWHCVPEHRPLGNQNRARRRMYQTLSRLRMTRNQVAHYEPTGQETFEQPAPAPPQLTVARAP